MLRKLLKTRAALVVETLLAAGLLFGVGFETADRLAAEKVRQARERAVQAVQSAAEIEREKARLEQRLAEALARAGQPRIEPPRPEARVRPTPGPEAEAEYRVLRRDRADLLLDGRLVVTLEEVGGGRPRMALIRLKVTGGGEGRKALKAGQEVRIRVDGQVYRLLVKEIYTSSVRYGLLPVN